MQILKEIKVPTGEIYTAKGDKGVLEFLTVADYGKDANIKADFLGITRELNGVPNRWRCSKGCETERRVADACGIPVVGVIGEAHDLQILNAI